MSEVRSRGARALAGFAGMAAALALLMCLAMGLGVEKAHALTTEDGWKYQVNTWMDKPEVQLLDYQGDQTEVVVPQEIDGYPVTYVYLNYGHAVKSLDASGCSNLQGISVSSGKLERLNVAGCTSLGSLNCENNALSSLDISDCTALQYLYCDYNYIEDLTALKAWAESHKDDMRFTAHLEPQYDKTTGFAYSVGDSISASFGNVEEHGHGAYITGWDGSSAQVAIPSQLGGADVVYADLSRRGIEGLDVAGCPTLRKLVCSYNYLTDLAALEAWGAQDGHEVDASPQFDAATGFAYEVRNGEQGFGAYAIEFDYQTPRETVVMPATVQGEPLVSISSHIIMCDFLDLTQCVNLKSFFSGYSGIPAIDASGLSSLTHFVCEASGVYALDVSDCASLVHFSCNENSLTSLDVSDSPLLRYLDCSRNQLSSLDLAVCPQLEEVRCNDNALTSLDISALSKLTRLRCANNYLDDLTALEQWGAVEGHDPWLTPQKVASDPVAVRLDRSALTLAHDGVEQLAATLVPGGAAAQVVWATSDASVVSVDATGKVVAAGPGKAVVTASTAQGFETACLVTVLAAPSGDAVTGIVLDKTSVDMGFVTTCPLCGKSHGGEMAYQSGNYLRLSYTFADPAAAAGAKPDPSVLVADPTIATVSLTDYGRDEPGVQEVYVRALAKGSTTATITVKNADGTTAQAKLAITVSESGTPSFTMAPEREYRIDATATSVVKHYGMGNPDPDMWLNPLANISYFPGMVTNAGQQEHRYARYLKSVTSDNEGVVGIKFDDHSALMDFKSPGSANVTVTDIWGHTGTTKVIVRDVDAVVSVPSLELGIGESFDLTKAVSGESYDPYSVSFKSADPSIAAVDDHWDDVAEERFITLKAVAAGETTVKVMYGLGDSMRELGTIAVKVAGSVVVPVTGVQLDAPSLDLFAGAEGSQLTATVLPADASNKSVTWTSSDEKVATVTSDGTVVPVGVGSTVITATTADGGHTATCTVTVSQHAEGVQLDKHEATLVGASTLALKATVAPDNATNKDVSWSSSDEQVATVDATGVVTAVGKGSATITVVTNDGAHTDTCAVTVTNPVTGIDLAPSATSLAKGDAITVEATLRAALSGAMDEAGDVTWSVSDPSVVRVDEAGKAFKGTALKSGSATITASLEGASGVKATCRVTVTNPVQSVTLSESARTLTVGDDAFTLKAAVEPSDADDTRVTWTSSDPNVVSVDASGTVTARAAGAATIAATAGGVSAFCTVTVNAKQIAATPAGSGFSASVTVADSATAKVLDKIKEQAGGALNLVVAAVEQLTEPAKQAVEQLIANGAKVAETFDIHFAKDNGEEIVVGKDENGEIAMTVKVKLTDSMNALRAEGLNLQVHYVGENGDIESMRTWVEGEYLCFVTSHFSDYVVTGEPQQTGGEGEGEGGQGTAPLNPVAPLAPSSGEPLAATGDATGVAATGTLVLAVIASLAVAGAWIARRRSGMR